MKLTSLGFTITDLPEMEEAMIHLDGEGRIYVQGLPRPMTRGQMVALRDALTLAIDTMSAPVTPAPGPKPGDTHVDRDGDTWTYSDHSGAMRWALHNLGNCTSSSCGYADLDALIAEYGTQA